MDPNANLAHQAILLAKGEALTVTQRRELAEYRRALLGWLSAGGFQPDWQQFPDAAKAYKAWVRKYRKFQDLAR